MYFTSQQIINSSLQKNKNSSPFLITFDEMLLTITDTEVLFTCILFAAIFESIRIILG